MRDEQPITSLDGRPNIALLVVDVQCGVLDQSVDHDGVVGRIAELVDCAAANHDGAKYADPERFDLDRFPDGQLGADHVAFGHGEHFCIGARLARAEARIAFGCLLDRTTDVALTAAANRFDVNRSFSCTATPLGGCSPPRHEAQRPTQFEARRCDGEG